jgi:diguanylate cyclase (GGDEF)-like protein
VVEDDAATARLLEHLLTRNGYNVRLAMSIASARAVLSREPVDLVVLDRMLPDGDGLELTRDLKVDSGALTRYVLMLTSISSEEAKVEGFDGGVDDYVTKPFAHEELLARVRAGLRIVELQKALIATNLRLEVISTTDAITGIHNRRWFDENLERSFAHASRYQRALSLAIVDVDHFKRVNDTYGHLAGDSVLCEVAQRIAGTLRKSDSLARVGGEEFGVILPEAGLFDALQFAEKIRSAVNGAPIEAAGESLDLTISVGVASIPHSTLAKPVQMIRYADQALYRAKNRGRNRVELERRVDPSRTSVRRDAKRERSSSELHEAHSL